MALLIVYDTATTIQEQTNRRPFPLRISEGERDSRAFFNFLGLLGNMVRAESDKSSWLGENVQRL